MKLTPLRALTLATVLLTATLAAGPSLATSTEPQPAQSAPISPDTWDCNARTLDLDAVTVKHAPMSPEEREADGSLITSKPGPDGSWVPVILVHGWTARSTHPNTDGTTDTTGTFSHNIDLTTNRSATADVGRSLIGQLQGLPAAAVFTYDYHDYSGRWVTDPHIGPGLGKTISCLEKASGNPVIVIGHSMGGLAARQALTQGSVTEDTAAVITLGTPHDGSALAEFVAGAGAVLDADQSTIFTALMASCGAATSARMDSGGVCGLFPPFVAAFDGSAGNALRRGSSELAALPPVPDGVPFYTLAGQSKIALTTQYGWFGVPVEPPTVDMGDIVVGTTSAHPANTTDDPYNIECDFAMKSGPTGDLVVSLGLVTEQDQGTSLNEIAGACFHLSLPRDINLTNEIIGLTSETITTITGAMTYPVPEYCDQAEREAPIGESTGPLMSGGDMEAPTWLEGPLAWAANGTTVDVVQMGCTAGGVTWPEALLFYDPRTHERLDELFLGDLQPYVYRGGYTIDKATQDGGVLRVPYLFEVSGGRTSRTGSVDLDWDSSKQTVKVANQALLRVQTSQWPAFTTPSGNIVCSGQIIEMLDVMQCAVASYDFEPPKDDNGSCNSPRALYFTVPKPGTGGQPQLDWDCFDPREDFLAQASEDQLWELDPDERYTDPDTGNAYATLEYGTTLVWEETSIECTSESTGLTCTDSDTGQGFTLSKRAFTEL